MKPMMKCLKRASTTEGSMTRQLRVRLQVVIVVITWLGDEARCTSCFLLKKLNVQVCDTSGIVCISPTLTHAHTPHAASC